MGGCQLSLQVILWEIKDTLKGKDAVIHNQELTTSPLLIFQRLQIMYLTGYKNQSLRYVFVKNKLSMKTVSLAERIEIHTKNTSLVFLCLEQINNKTCKYIALQEFYTVCSSTKCVSRSGYWFYLGDIFCTLTIQLFEEDRYRAETDILLSYFVEERSC